MELTEQPAETKPDDQKQDARSLIEQLSPRQWQLFPKLAAVVIIGIVLSVVGVTTLSIQRERATFEAELQERIGAILETVSAAGADAIYLRNVDQLETLTDRLIRADEDILSIEVYDAEGRVLATTSGSELERTREADPLGVRLADTEGVLYEPEETQVTAGQAVLAGRTVIGSVSVVYSIADLPVKLARVRQQGLLAAVLASLLGISLALLVSRSLTRPLLEIVVSTRHIAEGKLDTKVPVQDGGDEIAVLSKALENMRRDLKMLYEDLEGQVMERTIELVEARNKAEEANRIKSQFLSIMSHELRTPLNAINGFAQILAAGMAGELTEKQKHNVKRILANGEELLGLVNNILDISKIEAGHIELEPEEFEVREWITGLVDRHRSLASDKDLTLTVHIDEKAPEKVYGDLARLTQIVTNLVGNAIKFTDEGEVKVDVSTMDDEQWRVQVIDSGVGIPPHALEFIFDEFRQVDSSSTRKHSGTGLGLSIARKLTLLMEGTIKADSAVGKGSTFTVSLPVRQKSLALDGHRPSSDSSEQKQPEAADKKSKASVLISSKAGEGGADPGESLAEGKKTTISQVETSASRKKEAASDG